MATLKESLQIAAKNPNSVFAQELRKRIEMGQYNQTAQREGVDISGFVKTATPPTPEPNPLSDAASGVGGFIKGAAQEIGQRIASVPQSIGKVVSGITEKMIGTKPDESATELAKVNTLLVKKLGELPEGDTRRKSLEDAISGNQKALDVYNQEVAERQQKEQAITERPGFLTPKTKAEKAGATTERIAEFFVPAGFGLKALNATKYGQALKQAEDLNIIGKATRSLIKGIGEGAEFGLKTAAQNATEAPETQLKRSAGSFLLGLALTPVIDAAGAVIKYGVDKITKRLPERLMSTIFKTSEDDLRAEWNSIAKGKVLDKTLAREALENDMFGSSEKMGVYAIKKLADVEKAVQVNSKASSAVINIGKEQTKKSIEFLKDIAEKYDGPFSQVGPTAEALAKEIVKGKGNMNANLVLRLKRFFDALRNNSSFMKNENLSLKQEGLKNAANVFRQKLYDAGFKEAMEQERIFIEAIEAVVKDAARRGNRNVIGIVDLLAGGGGMVAGGPLSGVSAAVAIRAVQLPPVITGVARGLFRAGEKLGQAGSTVSGIVKPATQLGAREILKNQTNQ